MVKSQKVSVFIDAEYVINSAKSLKDKPFEIDISKGNINWPNLAKNVARIGSLLHIYYYTSVLNRDENEETYNAQERYLEKLQDLGIITRLGKMVKIKDNWVQKGVDIQMAIDIVTEKCDIAVLVTGDSDFEPAVKKSKERGKEVFLVTFSRNGGQTPKDFIELCSSHDVIDYRTGKNLGIWN
jgi:uncharacterized LabA/DUF88 family protein